MTGSLVIVLHPVEDRRLSWRSCNSRGGERRPTIVCAVQVVVGNLVYEVGRLQYETVESEGGGAADYWIVGSAVGGGAMLTVILIILVVYKRKSTRAERQFKRLQLQLDSLESNIRNECKQGARALFP